MATRQRQSGFVAVSDPDLPIPAGLAEGIVVCGLPGDLGLADEMRRGQRLRQGIAIAPREEVVQGHGGPVLLCSASSRVARIVEEGLDRAIGAGSGVIEGHRLAVIDVLCHHAREGQVDEERVRTAHPVDGPTAEGDHLPEVVDIVTLRPQRNLEGRDRAQVGAHPGERGDGVGIDPRRLRRRLGVDRAAPQRRRDDQCRNLHLASDPRIPAKN